jgi:hypothetical protein
MPQLTTLVNEVVERFNARKKAGLPVTDAFWEESVDQVEGFGRAQDETVKDFFANYQLDQQALLTQVNEEFGGVDEQDLSFEDIKDEADTLAAEQLKQVLVTKGMNQKNATTVAMGVALTL